MANTSARWCPPWVAAIVSRSSSVRQARTRATATGERAGRRPDVTRSRTGRTRGKAAVSYTDAAVSPYAGQRLKDSALGPYYLVWISALVLLAIGLCMILSVSVSKAVTPGGSTFDYVRDQGITAIIGVLLMILISILDYRRWVRIVSVIALVGGILFLLAMNIPGVSTEEKGSSSWIILGPISLQPSEFAKLALVMAGAHLLSMRRVVPGDFRSLMVPFGVVGFGICGLVLLEPDLGAAVITAGLVLGLLWVAGMKVRHWLPLAGAGVGVALLFALTSSVRKARIFSFLDPGADPQGAGWQLSQALVALGRGGWFGVGPGQSVQKFTWLPEAHNDMIFAILGEEFGLLGTGAVILLFVVFALAVWRLARQCADPLGRYLLAGCGMLVMLQAVVNIGGVVGALPITGVPLPFMSLGRNSLLVMLIATGLILSVARWAPARPTVASDKGYNNVTYIDRRRRDGGPRRTRSGVG